MPTEQDLQAQEAQLNVYESQANQILSQPLIERKYGSGVTVQQQQAQLQQQQQAQQTLRDIAIQRQRIADYRAAVADAAAREKQQQEIQSAGHSGAQFSGGQYGLKGQALKAYQQARFNVETAKAAKQNQQQSPPQIVPIAPPGFTLQSTAQGYVATNIKTGEKYVLQPRSNANSPSGISFNFVPEKEQQTIDLKSQQSTINNGGNILFAGMGSGKSNSNRTSNLPSNQIQNVEEAAPSYGFFSDIHETLSRQDSIIAGLINSLLIEPIQGLQFIGQLNKNAMQGNQAANRQIFSNIIFDINSRLQTGEYFPEIGQILREKPYYSTGYAAGQIVLIKPEVVVSVSDIIRTIGLKELPAENIIAKEFFEGQKYPTITPGETAGELLAEFKPILPEETKPAGFTASPREYAPITTAGKGTSELPGVYQAPQLSPNFLKVTQEEFNDLITPYSFPTFKPTIQRITPESFELPPGVTAISEVNKGLTDQIAKFLKENAELGKSYIPFIKTEKEAVIPQGTLLYETNRRFYIEFENRLIPIQELQAVNPFEGLSNKKLVTIEQADIKYSYTLKKPGLITPSRLAATLSQIRITSPLSSTPSFIKGIDSFVQSYINKSNRNIYVQQSLSISKSNTSSSIVKNNFSISRQYKSQINYTRYLPKNYYSNITPKTPYIITPKNIQSSVPRFKNKVINQFPTAIKNKSFFKPGYRAFVIQRKKKVFLPGIFSKGGALYAGELEAEKTLRATFGVQQSRFATNQPDVQINIPKNLFRNYRVSKGKRIPLHDEYIQRQTKRLTFMEERQAIQRARVAAQ